MDTLVDRLGWRAATHADRTACIFVGDSGDELTRITYGQLDLRARAIAAALQERGLSREPVLVTYPSSAEYVTAFLGCLYAGAIAVPAFPPASSRTRGRLAAIVKDAGARMALGSSPKEELDAVVPGHGVDVCPVESIPDSCADRWRRPELEPSTLAMLQYTSGSTSDPRGVMVTHENLDRAERMIQSAFGTTEGSVVAGWLPLFHDMGLIGLTLQPLFAGATTVLLRPTAFVRRPHCWLEAITRYRATISGGPNTAYDACVDGTPPDLRAQLDLTSWEVAFNGAEPVRRTTMERFAAAFAGTGFRASSFRPCYGLAEATLLVAASPSRAEVRTACAAGVAIVDVDAGAQDVGPAGSEVVSCGTPADDNDVRIVDPRLGTVPPEGTVGEIWIRGPHVARGYWNRPRESEATFGGRLAGGADGYLRTGDLGFVLDGEVYVTGRLKDLIIIRGRNHYPHDLEHTASASHPSLQSRPSAAFAARAGDAEYVVLVQEVAAAVGGQGTEIVAAIRLAVSREHDLALGAVVLVAPHTIPMTSSGKLRRGALRASFLDGTLRPLAEWRAPGAAPDVSGDVPPEDVSTLAAAWLRDHIAGALGWAPAAVDTNRPLLEYGLDSLRAVQLAHAIEARFGVELPPASLLEDTTIDDLVARLERARRSAVPTTEPTPIDGEHPASSGQQALWFQHASHPKAATYNIPTAVRIAGTVDVAALRRSFEHLVQRHPMLRAGFSLAEGVPHYRIRGAVPVPLLEEESAWNWSAASLSRRLDELAWRPFDLQNDLLLRARLFRRPDGDVLLVVVHHLVADLWSLALLLEELGATYSALTQGTPLVLPAPGAPYEEHVRLERMRVEAAGEHDFEYWARQLAEPLPILDLPIGRSAAGPETYRSAFEPICFDEGLTAALKSLGTAHGATLYMTLLAVFEALLHRYGGQPDIVVGTPVMGRSRRAFARTVGYFVNTLALRAAFAGDPTFVAHLGAVRHAVLRAFHHADYPFPLLVDRLQPARTAGVPPVFQTMFILQQAAAHPGIAALAPGRGGARVRAGTLALESVQLEERFSNFPLVLNLAEADGRIVGGIEFQIDRFERGAIARLAGHLAGLATSAVRNPGARVSRLELLTATERERAVVGWNETAVAWPFERAVHDAIAACAEAIPDAIAVVHGGDHITYRELLRRSDAIACALRASGVPPDRAVGICLERTIGLVVSLVGVLRSGAAFMPIDPADPPQRVDRMLEAAGVSTIITSAPAATAVIPGPGRTLLDVDTMTAPAESGTAPTIEPENLAYVMFTSGSTGQPKGVMSTHRGICNRLQWMQAAYPLDGSDRVLQKTPYTFDVSVWEFLWPLRCGAALVLADPGGHRDPRYLASLIQREQITIAHFVPSMLRVFLEGGNASACGSLRHVIASGEALGPDLRAEWGTQSRAALHNLYGPTEASVDVSHWTCIDEPDAATVPIGRPIANTQLYILDASLQVVPVGVPGELYIGGIGLARGYAGQPALTAASFVPDACGGAGGRLYRTGDIARYRQDGVIEFVGRRDDQIKIRGMRVELGEIEAALRAHPAVVAAVVTRGTGAAADSLAAHVVWANPDADDAAALIEQLRTQLPDHMVPAHIKSRESLPLTANGKLDRRALIAADHARPRLDVPFVAPRNPVEAQLAAIWQDVLELDAVGVHDNFFELGGHSLHIAQVLARLQAAFDVELPMGRFFDDPTIEQIALALAEPAGAANAAEVRS